jgi:bidirectional [NiFe] hydrogenase diaphorase subunit
MSSPPTQQQAMAAPLRVKTLKIDGLHVSGYEDQTILEVAREHGIEIPALCYMEGLSVVGACRLCIVEVAGSNKLLPSCATRIQEGMEVTTNSPRVQKYRRMILEMLFAERNHICAVCVANGNCELQTLAQELGVDHINMPYRNPKVGVDATHQRFAIDHNRCILCTRCVRVCGEIEGAHTWDVKDRGVDARVITDMDQDWGDSWTCTGCGKCVQVCPTGALFEKGTAVAEKQKREFLPYLTTMREVTR